MKNYIINFLNIAKEEGKKAEKSSYDTAFLKEIIDKVNNNEDYFYEFILDLDNDLLKGLINNIDPESSRESFLASVIYLKSLTEINKKEDVSIPLSKNQEEILYEVFELIKKVVEKYEKSEKEAKKFYKKYGQKYDSIINKFNNNIALTIEDYDLIDDLIKKYEKENTISHLNSVMDYLNSFNYPLLPEFKEDNQEEKVEIEMPSIEISEENEDIIISGITEKEETNNTDINEKENAKIDIFSPHSFEFTEEPKKPKDKDKKNKIRKEEKEPEIVEIEEEHNKDIAEEKVDSPVDNSADYPLKDIGILKTDFNSYCMNLINDGLNESAVKYYKDNLAGYFKENNYNGIVSILCLSNKEILEDLFNYFKDINLSEDIIKDLFNRATPIFFEKNKGYFKENASLALNYDANLDNLIKNNITYFYNTPEYNKNKLELLTRYGLDVKMIFAVKPQLLAIGLDKLLKNINLLKSLNIEIASDSYDNLSIISSNNLNIMIDSFIESGFSSYLFEGIKNIRTLIIKRIFYAFKNNLSIWNENITPDRINQEYDSWINKERKILTEEEINALYGTYHSLEYLEASKRPVFFTDASAASIKRKYEFKFGNIIISRYKVYSIFKVLVSHDVKEKEALFYAVTYNSNLEKDDYELIKKEILGK